MAKAPNHSARKSGGEGRRRGGRARSAGELVGEIGGAAFKRFGFVQSSIVSRWAEIVGPRYAKVSSPESIRFPAGRRSAGVLTLLVQGAHAPLMQHLAPAIIERVNRFFGYSAVSRIAFRQGSPAPAPEKQKRPELRPVPRELGEGLRQIADPELRACLESLAARIAASNGPPEIEPSEADPIPLSGVNPE
jgi:hypothetical protein